jgi:hypothetical protein
MFKSPDEYVEWSVNQEVYTKQILYKNSINLQGPMIKFPMKIQKTIASFWSFNSFGQSSDKKLVQVM